MNSTKILGIIKEFSQISLLQLNEEGYIKKIIFNSNDNIKLKENINIKNIFVLEDREIVENIFKKGLGQESRYLQISKKYSKGKKYVDINIKDVRGKTYAYLISTNLEKESEQEYEEKIQQLSIQAETDQLTGLLNRHAYWERVKKILNSKDINRKIGILFLDMDGLGEVNSKLGHKGGDRAIIQLTNLISKSIRPRDFAVRYGGDEFVIVVEEIPGKKSYGLSLAEKLVKDINGKKGRFLTTVSIGVHVVRVGNIFKKGLTNISLHRKWEEEVVKADKLTYKAKQLGKNCVASSKRIT